MGHFLGTSPLRVAVTQTSAQIPARAVRRSRSLGFRRRLQHFHCCCLSTTAAGLADFVHSRLASSRRAGGRRASLNCSCPAIDKCAHSVRTTKNSSACQAELQKASDGDESSGNSKPPKRLGVKKAAQRRPDRR